MQGYGEVKFEVLIKTDEQLGYNCFYAFIINILNVVPRALYNFHNISDPILIFITKQIYCQWNEIINSFSHLYTEFPTCISKNAENRFANLNIVFVNKFTCIIILSGIMWNSQQQQLRANILGWISLLSEISSRYSWYYDITDIT